VRFSTPTASQNRRIAGVVGSILLAIWLYHWSHPTSGAEEVLGTYRGEVAVPTSWEGSHGRSDDHTYSRSSYLLIPSLREITILENDHEPVQVHVERVAMVILIFLGLVGVFAMVKIWKARRGNDTTVR
jgi:hypothetical protein